MDRIPNQPQDPYENLPENDQLDDLLPETPASRWRVHVARVLALVLALSFLFLIFGGMLRLFGMPNLDFLLESRKLAQDPMIHDLMQAVVRVEADNRGGTGFNVAPAGLIITNDHITGSAEQASVSFLSDREQYTVADWLADSPSDLAFLALEDDALPYLELETLTLPEPGDPVLLIGNPLGFFRIVTRAVVLGVTWQEGRDSPVLVLDGPVYKGNSGSPVLNRDGRVIGVVYASTTGIESGKTAALAIPSAEIAAMLDHLRVSAAQP